ncbi:hypothetical protein ARALYDRAFT_893989 [Arabidopsis lyrata subsp. lyrata]|uniref:CoA carboxyltransferase N-terminal domain-containing protein n=1 Tax=Arabidopsis lyrata subsp. lyrata TaxID=81972 RepID=D7KRD8_ARALL|nr:hypothetical protein ARALYDRAFT_893989 [Arabidopsis lyrata subsp. lyrata]
MEKSWFNFMFSKGELEYRGELSKAMDSFAPGEKTTISQDHFIYDMDKNFYGWGERSSYSNNVDLLVSSKDIQIFFYSYCSSSYLNNRSKGDNDLHYDPYIKDTKYNCTNHINSCIDSYFRSYICIDSNFLSDSNNSNESYIYNFICSESGKIRESKNYKIRTNRNRSNLISSKDFDITQNYNQLWIQCDNCYGLMYKKVKMNVCEQCGYYLKMSSSERIELSIDPGTWNPMDEDMVSEDGRIQEIADPKMIEKMGQISEQELCQMEAFRMLSLRCIGPSEEVPTMVEVAKELKKIQRSLNM